jgi:uncharacterized phage protein (TIGR02220 family)
MKPPAFQMYAKDFLVGTAGMSDAEVGCYMRLLCYQWDKEGLPCDQDGLRRLLGRTEDVPYSVMAKFECNNGVLQNPRLEMEREKQASFRASRKKAAEARWGGQKKAAPAATAAAPAPEKNAKATLNEAAVRVLDKINALSGKGFRHVETNHRVIRARLQEKGITEEGVMRMLAHRWDLWKGTDMENYYRPETLFRPSKFENYLTTSQAQDLKPVRTQADEIRMLEAKK